MILVIAEKPSVGMTIAKVLGAKSKKGGYMEGNGYIISWCYGHLIGLAMPEAYDEKYTKWQYDTLPIVPDKWIFRINDSTKKQYDVLRTLMNNRDITELVCATDAGREGECIFRYVYNQVGCRKPFKRLWVSSLEEKAIKDGFNSLKDGSCYDNLYNSGLCRAKADWMVGMNLSRLYSILYPSKTGLHIGRVQTPTLAMIVQREESIKNFVKEKYFTVELNCGDFIAVSERVNKSDKAERIKSTCNGGIATVQLVKKETKTVNPPKLYDLTTLQREANRQYGYTAKQTLDYAQSLYESKLITYPRTDSCFLTDEMEQTALSAISLVIEKIPFASGFKYEPNVKRVMNSKKVSDHHALIPTSEIGVKDLATVPEGEKNILYLICAKLICATTEKHTYEMVTANIQCSDTGFTAKGKAVLQNGWKEFDEKIKVQLKGGNQEEKSGEDKTLPQLSENQVFENVQAGISEHLTSPQKHFTEDTLLSAMECAGNGEYENDADIEKKGLGTPATRANVIEELVNKGYIERKNKQMLPTQKGINLIKVVPEKVKSAKLTAEWETVLQKISSGEENADSFLSQIQNLTVDLINANPTPQAEYKNIFSDYPERETLGKCPKCGGNVYEGKSIYYCENNYGDKKTCSFFLKKDEKFFTWKKKQLTKSLVKSLLKSQKVSLTGLYSEKKDSTYDATVCMECSGQYVKFSLEF